MSVIVLGMEMPENCHECRLCMQEADTELGVCVPCGLIGFGWEAYSDRPDWCPLRTLSEKRRWIPVEEKLPEGVQSVLVRRKDGGIFIWEYSPYSPTDDIWVDEYSNVFSVYDATHWMELPEFPEEDKP